MSRRIRIRSAAVLVLVTSLALAPTTARSQEVFTPSSARHVRDAYAADMDTIHAKVMALANAIPAEKYSWRPAAGVRSVSEVLMHVVSEWSYWAPASLGVKPVVQGSDVERESRSSRS